MKTVCFLYRIILLFLLSATTFPVLAATHESAAIPGKEARVLILENRLEEIKAIDRAALSKAEKREMRREVREIKKELAAISGGVYLSIGAILLIALLLILLL